MTDPAAIAKRLTEAQRKAHNCPVYYKGESVLAATQSGMRAAACAEEYARLRRDAASTPLGRAVLAEIEKEPRHD